MTGKGELQRWLGNTARKHSAYKITLACETRNHVTVLSRNFAKYRVLNRDTNSTCSTSNVAVNLLRAFLSTIVASKIDIPHVK